METAIAGDTVRVFGGGYQKTEQKGFHVIKNVVFDYGNVLGHFDLHYMVGRKRQGGCGVAGGGRV